MSRTNAYCTTESTQFNDALAKRSAFTKIANTSGTFPGSSVDLGYVALALEVR